MALIIKDRVKEITTTTGTGAVSLGGASATFDAFQDVMSNGDTTFYAIVHTASATDEWEVGLGTWNTGNTLTRTTVYAGSSGTSAVNFSSGNKDVFMTYPAGKAAVTGEDVTFADITVTGTVDGRDVATDGTKLDTIETSADVTDATNVAAAGALMKSGGTMTGNLILNADPTTALGAATKEYVDTIAAAGIHYHTPVRVEAPSNLNATYDNGSSGVGATLTNAGTQAAITIDGVALSSADRVLVYNQTNAAHNGIYTVTTVGDGSTNWVLTRATDADSYGASDPDAFGEGDAFFVKEGDTGAGELYVMNTSGVITFGTTAITFVVIAETAVYSAGTGLTLTGTTFSTNQDISTSASPTFAGTTVNGNIVVTGTVDGRDVATDGTKLDGIEANADVTDTANVTAAGALMDSEVTNLAQVKSFSSADYATAAQGTKADNALPKAGGTMTGNIVMSGTETVDGRDLSVDGAKLDSIEAGATADQTASEILAAIKTVDGTASGLDADLLDGQQGSYYLNTSTTFSGDVSGTYNAISLSSNTVGASELDVTGNGTTSQFLRSDGDGSFTWATPTNTTYTAGPGIILSGTTFSHDDTSSQASVNGSGRTYIQDITLDTYGHVTGIATATETVVNTDTNTTDWRVANSAGTEQFAVSAAEQVRFAASGAASVSFNSTTQTITISATDTNTDTNQLTTFQVEDGDGTEVTISHGKEWKFVEGGGIDINWTDTSTGSDADPYDLTFTHADTSSQASVDNSNGTVIQDVTLDGYGHVTGLGSVDLDSRYVNVTGDTMTGDLLVQDDIKSTGQIRATGWWNTNTGTSGDDLAVEMGVSGGQGYILSYNRNTSSYGALNFNATSFSFDKRPTFSGNTAFDDGYHPNADTWTTGRTIALTGDVTGTSGAFNGSGNLSFATNIASNVVGASELNVTGNGTTAQFLRSDGDGSFTWATPTDTNTTYSAGTGVTLSGTTFSIGQAVATTDSPTFANAYIGDSIYHTGDTDTRLLFGTNTVTLQCGGSSEITVNTTGVRLGDTGNGYFQPVTGNYGSVQIDGGSHGAWEGYSIGGRAVFMHDNNTATGLYDDVNNKWLFYALHGSYSRMYHNGQPKIEATSTGATITGDLNSTSDIRYKKNIETIDGALEKVKALRGVTFDWDNDAFKEDENTEKPTFTERATGVIAQDVEKVLPEAVRENEDGFKNVAYGNMVGLLVEAIKEQQAQIDELKKQLNG